MGDWVTCSCGKRGWTSRRPAKAAARELLAKRQHPLPLAVYRCDRGETGLFHVGHTYKPANLNDPRLTWIAP